jgi:tetratricopeptide (TPR) repeat protein
MLGHREVQNQQADFKLHIPLPKMMTEREEMNLVRRAAAQDPAASEYRYRLAHLLFTMDVFDEAIDLLRSLASEVSEFRVFHLLGTALLARETAQDNIAAKRFAKLAVDVAGDKYERSRALALLGKVHARLSETGESRDRLVDALKEDVANKDAYKRLAMLDFQAERNQEASDYAEQMLANGVRHCRVLGVRPLALAKLGRMDEAREAFGLERFFQQSILSPPPTWPTIEAFNRELAAELSNHPGIRRERYGTASTHSWRVDEPALARSRLVPELQKLIVREATAHAARLSGDGHPWLRARPTEASLHNWCVMTDGDGFEEWHVHQNGWLSGAYYVDVPDFIVEGKGAEGCIMFGLPPGIVGEDRHVEFGSRLIRPRSGLMLLFPSHLFHRTFAHRGDRRRICFAFDVASESGVN